MVPVSRQTKRAYWKASRTNAVADWLQYKKIPKLAQTAVAEAKDKYLNSALPTLLKTGRTVNLNPMTSFPALKNADGRLLPTNECGETLNKHLSYVFTDELSICDSFNVAETKIRYSFPEVVIAASGVACVIDRLSQITSPGLDAAGTKLLKLTVKKSQFLRALTFKKSLDSSFTLQDWRIVEVTSIFQSGDSSNPANYRHIFITSVCCKVLEHILYCQVLAHRNLNLLLETERGFRQNRSCQTQLFELITDLPHSFAFFFLHRRRLFRHVGDRVPHNRSLLKIRHLQ